MAYRMKLYQGRRLDNGDTEVIVEVLDSKGRTINVYNLQHHIRHSPDGFEWGYGGSGPAELARCILIDNFNGDIKKIDNCPGLYQDFKSEIVATFGPGWILDGNVIVEWLRKNILKWNLSDEECIKNPCSRIY